MSPSPKPLLTISKDAGDNLVANERRFLTLEAQKILRNCFLRRITELNLIPSPRNRLKSFASAGAITGHGRSWAKYG